MFNTLIIVLTFLETSKVFSQEIPLSQTSPKTIKRFSNTQSSNTTFWIDQKNQENIYYSIELQILQPNYVDLALLYSYGQPSFIKNDEIIFDDMDYDGFAQHSKKHFVQVENTNETVYFTVLSNVSVSFDIIIKSSNTELCQNDCGLHGICVDGECNCNEGYIGRDCSQPALQLLKNNRIEFGGPQLGLTKQYFYYQQDGTESLSLEVKNKVFQEVEVYIIVPNTIYLPTKEIYNQAAIVTNDQPFNIQINQNKQQNSDTITEDNQITDEFIVLIYGSSFDITLNVLSNENKGEKIKLIIIIVCSVVGALLLCIVAVLLRRAKQRRDREKQSPEVEMEIREKQLAYPPQFNKQELDEYIQIVGKDSLKDNQDNCAICLDPLNNNASLRTTPCKHVFHSACIEKWLNKNHFCPFCRYDLKIDSLKQSNQVVIKVPITNIIRIQRNN